MKSFSNRWVRGLLLVAALALLVWTLSAVSVAEVWQQLRGLQPMEIAGLAAVNAFVLLTLCARWWLFLYAQGHKIPFLRLLGYRLTAFGISYFTPGPHFGGEPWQVYAVSRRHGVPYADSIAAVTLDKLVEMLVNFAFLAAGVFFLFQFPFWLDGSGQGGETSGAMLDPSRPPALFQLALYVLILLAIPATLLFAYRQGFHPVTGTTTRLLQLRNRLVSASNSANARIPAWLHTIEQSESRIGTLCRHQPVIFLAALAISVVSWLVVVWEFWLMTQALGLGLTASQAVPALLAARIAILLPMPAAIGALEAGQAWVMTGLGRGPAAGIGITLLIRARDTLLALLGLWFGGVGLWHLLRGNSQAGVVLETTRPKTDDRQSLATRPGSSSAD